MSGLNPAHLSKINWTQAISIIATIVAMFGIDLDAETQAAVVSTIAGATTVLTFVFRTWFTG